MPIVTRFPAAWLASLTGDCIRVVTTVRDYGRKSGECWASDQTIADRLGLSRGGVNRMIRKAEALGLVGSSYYPRTGTRSRQVRPLREDELAVCVSARARADLAGTRFKVYSALSVREHLGEPTSLAQLSRMCGITVETARVVAAELVADGWVERQGKGGGAFQYVVHAVPVAGVATQLSLFPQPQQSARPADEETGTGSDRSEVEAGFCSGQLALVDPALTPLELVTATPLDSVTAPPLDLVAQTGNLDQDLVNRQVAGGCCSREAERSVARERAGSREEQHRAGASSREPLVTVSPLRGEQQKESSAEQQRGNRRGGKEVVARPSTAGHHHRSATFPDDVRLRVALAPVAGLWGRLSGWQQDQVESAAKAELVRLAAVLPQPDFAAQLLADRLADRLNEAGGEVLVRSPYGWLTHRGLPRRSACTDVRCDDGIRLDTRRDCEMCANVIHLRRAGRAAITAQVDRDFPGLNPHQRRQIAEERLRRRTAQEAEDLARRKAQAAVEQSRAKTATAQLRADAEDAERVRRARPCADCGMPGAAGLCPTCGEKRTTETTIRQASVVAAAGWSDATDRHDIDAVIREAEATVRAGIAEAQAQLSCAGEPVSEHVLAVAGRLAAQNAADDCERSAVSSLARSPEAETEAALAYEATMRSAHRYPTRAAASDAAAEAAEQARQRTARHLLDRRITEILAARSTRQELIGIRPGSWTCSDCGRTSQRTPPQSGRCLSCELTHHNTPTSQGAPA
ncbi:hypothetical protein K7472_30330 [Streptomyces sp. PTM05]|uniref:Helix-turn-helix domain-containing protein n=1 Tax=Streptantibioticus parmotrematis TaxID=2873249 RepID=A0ABS7R2D6_9ACTN|nr:hypothetical protein [Streptantibioticus parmotrematis]MBY8889111.1 hypothetical protein [Streptantibioticus parmotrematis]